MRIGPLELLVIGVIAVILLLMLFTARDSRAVNVELSETFGDPLTPSPGPNAIRWALGVLDEAGVDADSDAPYAARLLIAARPGLSHKAATALVKAIA